MQFLNDALREHFLKAALSISVDPNANIQMVEEELAARRIWNAYYFNVMNYSMIALLVGVSCLVYCVSLAEVYCLIHKITIKGRRNASRFTALAVFRFLGHEHCPNVLSVCIENSRGFERMVAFTPHGIHFASFTLPNDKTILKRLVMSVDTSSFTRDYLIFQPDSSIRSSEYAYCTLKFIMKWNKGELILDHYNNPYANSSNDDSTGKKKNKPENKRKRETEGPENSPAYSCTLSKDVISINGGDIKLAVKELELDLSKHAWANKVALGIDYAWLLMMWLSFCIFVYHWAGYMTTQMPGGN